MKCLDKIKDHLNCFITGLRNIIKWSPIIWNDRDWDHTFIYEVLRFKLKRTEKCLRNGIHLNADKTADKIKLCVLLLDRLLKDGYNENVFLWHNKKWGKPKLDCKPCDDKEGYSVLDIKRKNVKTIEDEEQERREFRQLMHHENYMVKQDLSMLFNIMKKHIQNWWD